MPRPKKWRKVCTLPSVGRFGALDHGEGRAHIVMSVDEYETIRLIDFEGMKQDECAHSMNVARSTVTAIYESARKKLASSIVNGDTLIIQGGEYQLCDGGKNGCRGRGCQKKRIEEKEN